MTDTPAATEASIADTSRFGEAEFDWETGIDMVCSSLAVLTNLLATPEVTGFTNVELSNLLWMIEEKAKGVRKAVHARIRADAARSREARPAATPEQES